MGSPEDRDFLKTMSGSLIALIIFVLCAAALSHYRHEQPQEKSTPSASTSNP